MDTSFITIKILNLTYQNNEKAVFKLLSASPKALM